MIKTIRHKKSELCSLAVLLALFSSGASASQSCVAEPSVVNSAPSTSAMNQSQLPETMTKEVESAVRRTLDYVSAPGVIVGIQTPEGIWKKAWGVADPATGEAMKAGMHTRIGSVTKTFTGTLLMQLADAGKLSLDDTIDTYVAGVPNGNKITLRHLANMTSGVSSYTRAEAFLDIFFEDPSQTYTPEQLLNFALPASPEFEPGASFDYSNTNTVLLGMVIEQVTGKPIEQSLSAMILEPLGLTNTVWPGNAADMPDPFAQGFTLQGNAATPKQPSNATHWNPSWGWTAGEMISTMDDLLIYGRALGTGKGLLSPAAQQTRLTSFPDPMGYGIGMGCAAGWVGHTGELPGYNTTLFYHVASDTTVVVQANSDIRSGDCSDEEVLPNNPTGISCASPASRVFEAVSVALGHPFSMTAPE